MKGSLAEDIKTIEFKQKISGNRIVDKLLWLMVAVLAVLPGIWTSIVALVVTVGLYVVRRRLRAGKLKLST